MQDFRDVFPVTRIDYHAFRPGKGNGTGGIQVPVLRLDISPVCLRQVQEDAERDILGKCGLRLDQNQQFVSHHDAQIVVLSVCQDILQRDGMTVAFFYMGILRMKRKVKFPHIFRLMEQVGENAVADSVPDSRNRLLRLSPCPFATFGFRHLNRPPF